MIELMIIKSLGACSRYAACRDLDLRTVRHNLRLLTTNSTTQLSRLSLCAQALPTEFTVRKTLNTKSWVVGLVVLRSSRTLLR